MINSFNNYLRIGKAKKKTADPEESSALLEKAKNRLKYVKSKEINKDTSQFVLEDAYEAAREAAQSLMSLKGFKPYSHEATIAFIRDYYSNFTDEELNKFDRFRQLRHNSIYKAEPVSNEDAKSCILFAALIVQKIKDILDK